MLIKRILVIAAVLLFANATYAQSNQLRQSASQLASEATSFADASYNDYSRAFRQSVGGVGAVMAAQQFSAGAQLFNRMVNDRRPNQELREAYQLLLNLSSSADRTTLQQSRWSNIQRLMSDLASELSYDSGGNQFPRPGQSGPYRGSGRMTWRGKVDDDVRIVIRGGTAEVETIGGSPYYDAATNFAASLPLRRVNVQLVKRRGRGEVFIEQQPSRENDYAAVIRIRDPRGGASDYEFELSW
jgi:hypothetical protein